MSVLIIWVTYLLPIFSILKYYITPALFPSLSICMMYYLSTYFKSNSTDYFLGLCAKRWRSLALSWQSQWGGCWHSGRIRGACFYSLRRGHTRKFNRGWRQRRSRGHRGFVGIRRWWRWASFWVDPLRKLMSDSDL